MRKLLLITLFLIIRLIPASAHFDFNKRLEDAYNDILTLHFNEARQLLNQEKIEKPGNELRLLYENYIDFLEAFISEEKPRFEEFKRDADLRIEQISNNDKNHSSPFFLYSLAEIYIQQSLVRIKFEEHVSAAAEMRKAYKLIERNTKLYPSFVLNQKISGFIHALVGAVPAKYNWVVNLAGMSGNVSEGMSELQNSYQAVSQSAYNCYQLEILFYLGTLYSVFSTSAEVVPLLPVMKTKTEKSPLISYVYSNIMMKRGNNDEALWALNQALTLKDVYPFTFLYYKRALCTLRKLDLTATEDFRFFLMNYHGINNIKSAYQKMAWIGILNNDTPAYHRNMQLCMQNGRALLDEDKDAEFEAASGEVINLYLLRSRLYFDGGYYQNALAELTGKSILEFPRFKDQLEITYRLGRIMQMMGNTDKAIHNYEVTIKNGSSSPWHFAANSSLMLGSIYEDNKDYEKAILCYQKCLSLKFELYKNSIDQKAQAAIDRVRYKMKKH